MDKASKTTPAKPTTPSEARVERILRLMLEGMGAAVDRKLDPQGLTQGGLSARTLITRMKRLIDDRIFDDEHDGRFAPHLLKLKIEWGTHSGTSTEALKELEQEILVAAIDHINDHRYRTFAPVRTETIVDIFTTGISIDPIFGEFEGEIKLKEQNRRKDPKATVTSAKDSPPEVRMNARITGVDGTENRLLVFHPGGRRLSVGRAGDNDINLNHPSVSKIHAAMVMNQEGTLLLADTGSTNGTFINGRRIAYGESRQVTEGDVVAFGDVEVRFRKN